MPELEAQDQLDALIALGHATLWTEDEVATIATAAQAAPLVEEVGDESAVAAVLAMESQGLAMRGDEGDLGRALELGDRALELWIPGTRALDLAQHLHLHADTTYWAGQYERSMGALAPHACACKRSALRRVFASRRRPRGAGARRARQA